MRVQKGIRNIWRRAVGSANISVRSFAIQSIVKCGVLLLVFVVLYVGLFLYLKHNGKILATRSLNKIRISPHASTTKKSKSIDSESESLQRHSKADPNSKLVVLWTDYFESSDWFHEKAFNLNLDSSNCSHSNCIFSTDRVRVKEADAVLFHASDFSIHDVPIERNESQIYIWYTLEAPGVYDLKKRQCVRSLTDENGAGSKGFFNWTFSYHSESDVTVGYGFMKPRRDNSLVLENPPKKKKLAAWVVSNCKTDSERETYIEALQKHVKVDIYGYCTQRACPDDCFGYLGLRYHFYLAFENQRCTDYITEKVWVPLKAGLIPVVYGGANYSNYLPEKSFIDAGNYTPAELGAFLLRLSKDEKELKTYHSWRQNFTVETRPSWCELCTALQRTPKLTPVEPDNLLLWWLRVNKCYTNFTRKETPLDNILAKSLHSVIDLIKLF